MTTENPDSRAPEPSASSSSSAEGDAAYLRSLRAAGWLRELEEPQLDASSDAGATPDAGTTPDAGAAPDAESRRLELVLAYYFAPDTEAAARRRAEDRFFVHDVDEPTSANDLVSRLIALTPELGHVTLERIGSDDGPLVLRAGDHLAAVTDPEEDEEDLDTGQIDLSELEDSMTITVRGLVRAVNVLLDRFGIRERLVPLQGDGRREAYGALPVAAAMTLYRAGALDVTHAERLFEFAAW